MLRTDAMSSSLEILAFDHVGIRVADAPRSEAFYALFGFEVVFRDTKEPVVILRNARGVEINLVVNADPAAPVSNVLMDVAEKHAGITHVALVVPDLDETVRFLAQHAIPITGGPVRLGSGMSLFVRDPDRNVVELRVRDPRSAV